jgi:hypothetical protein
VALLVLQVVDITLPFRIGHAFVTTLCILRQTGGARDPSFLCIAAVHHG